MDMHTHTPSHTHKLSLKFQELPAFTTQAQNEWCVPLILCLPCSIALGDWSRLAYQHTLMPRTAHLAAKCGCLEGPLLIRSIVRVHEAVMWMYMFALSTCEHICSAAVILFLWLHEPRLQLSSVSVFALRVRNFEFWVVSSVITEIKSSEEFMTHLILFVEVT